MNHPDAEQLNAFCDNELRGEDARQVQEHLRSCQACGETLSEWLKIRAAFLNPEEPPVSPDFAYRVMNAIESNETKPFDVRELVRWLVPTSAFMFGALALIYVVPLNAAETIVMQNEILKEEGLYSVQETVVTQSDAKADWMGLEVL